MVVVFADVLKILFLIYVQLSCLISLVKTRRTNYLFFFYLLKQFLCKHYKIFHKTTMFSHVLPHSADYVNKMKKFCKILLKSLKLEFPKIFWKQAPNKKRHVPCTSTVALEEVLPCLFFAKHVYSPSSSITVLSMVNVELCMPSFALEGNCKLSFVHDITAAGSALVLQVSSNLFPT